MTQPLTPEDRSALLDFARRVVRHAVAPAAGAAAPPLPPTATPGLSQLRGAFVTLKIAGELRGCLGLIHAVKPLWESVRDMATAVTSQDPRFEEVREEELPRLAIEISALTPLEPVADLAAIQVGRDGLYLRRGGCSGLLLPQVATEQGWDRDAFLDHTCMKAGLPRDAWRSGAEIYRFSAEVFGDTP